MKNLFTKIKNPKVLRVLLVILFIILGSGAAVYVAFTNQRIFIDTSIISAPVSTLAPSVPGKLQELDVYEGQTISKGDTIAIVDGHPLFAVNSGLIITANNQIGSIVGGQNPVAQMIDPTLMRVAGTIDENKGLSDIVVGQVVSFTVDALPGQTFWGYVDEVAPSAKQTQLSFSISSERPTQQFVVYARFDGKKYPQIKNGMSAKMTVFTNTK